MAGLDQYAITGDQLAGRQNALFVLFSEANGRQGQGASHGIAGMPAAATRTGLYVTAKERKESEHGGRVEVDLAFAGDHRKTAEGVSTTNGDGDGYIHAQYPRAQVTHRIAEERQGRKEHHWRSEGK